MIDKSKGKLAQFGDLMVNEKANHGLLGYWRMRIPFMRRTHWKEQFWGGMCIKLV